MRSSREGNDTNVQPGRVEERKKKEVTEVVDAPPQEPLSSIIAHFGQHEEKKKVENNGVSRILSFYSIFLD